MSLMRNDNVARFNVRGIWLLLRNLAGAIVMIGVALAVVTYGAHVFRGRHVSSSQAILAAVAIAFVGMVARLFGDQLEKPLDGSSADALLRSYRMRFFLWVGIGEFPTFASMVAVAITGRWPIYLVGALFAFIAYARIAPTSAHLDHDQQQITEAGSMLSLRDVLNGTHVDGSGLT